MNYSESVCLGAFFLYVNEQSYFRKASNLVLSFSIFSLPNYVPTYTPEVSWKPESADLQLISVSGWPH